jgi:hypothetical protein
LGLVYAGDVPRIIFYVRYGYFKGPREQVSKNVTRLNVSNIWYFVLYLVRTRPWSWHICCYGSFAVNPTLRCDPPDFALESLPT